MFLSTYLIVKPINPDNSVCNLEFKINIISKTEFKRQLCCGGSGLPVITSVQSCYVRVLTLQNYTIYSGHFLKSLHPFTDHI